MSEGSTVWGVRGFRWLIGSGVEKAFEFLAMHSANDCEFEGLRGFTLTGSWSPDYCN